MISIEVDEQQRLRVAGGGMSVDVSVYALLVIDTRLSFPPPHLIESLEMKLGPRLELEPRLGDHQNYQSPIDISTKLAIVDR